MMPEAYKMTPKTIYQSDRIKIKTQWIRASILSHFNLRVLLSESNRTLRVLSSVQIDDYGINIRASII